MQTSNRLYNLDYLRGLAAFGIMIYHYFSWIFGTFSSNTFMGRIGLYGVSIFYVLSGLTLYYVYYENMKICYKDIFAFAKKRFFRIFPLLWLVTISAILLSGKTPDWYNLFLNLTGLFGFIKWDTYFSAGIWSIGNELVFYVFFPFFVLFAKSNKKLLIILSVTIFLLYIYFAFNKLDSQTPFSYQWKNYINPLNQVFLFLGGFLTGLLFKKVKINSITTILLLLFGIALFAFYPVNGDRINLVTGVNRLIFTFCCFLICFCFYKLTIKFPEFIHKPLTLLGEVSYSVYLLHPLVWSIIFNKYLLTIPVSIKASLSVIFTLIISYFTYQYFEKFFMKIGRKNKVT